MKKFLGCLVLSLALGLVAIQVASAHPLGNFTVNRYSRLEVGRATVQLRYVLDLAEIPTLQELHASGVPTGKVDERARQRLLPAKAQELSAGARLTIDGQPVTWSIREATLELLPGQAELDTLRVALTLIASVDLAEGARLQYRDTNYSGRLGWHEVVLHGVEGVRLADSTVPARDVSNELRDYPDEANRAPLDVSSASATLIWGSGAGGQGPESPTPDLRPPAPAARFALDPTADRLARLLGSGAVPNPLVLLMALLVAAGLGAAHALEPGHGKTIVGSYLVGSRGTAKHAVLLGLTVTVTHTLGVYLLGLVTLVAAQYVLPERLYPILGVASGTTLATIGLSLAWTRLRAIVPHIGGRQQRHEHGHGHHHTHGHGHGGHTHGRGSHGAVIHSHGWGNPHVHLPSVADGSPVTIRGLLALGISGGLLPCPSALVVLLAAISFQNVALGMLLVAAFSVGLAAVLTVIGLLVLYGGRLLGRSPAVSQMRDSRLVRAMPTLSALAITVAGFGMVIQAARPFV